MAVTGNKINVMWMPVHTCSYTYVCMHALVEESTVKVLGGGGHSEKLKFFSISEVEFLWKASKFKRGHGPLACLFRHLCMYAFHGTAMV